MKETTTTIPYPDLSCPKCGCLHYEPTYDKESYRTEKLRWKCERCGYVTFTPTLDTPPGGKE